MTTWPEVAAAVATIDGVQLSDTAWRLDPQTSFGKAHVIFVSLEVLQPDMQFLRLFAPVAADHVDGERVLSTMGSRVIGSIIFSPFRDKQPRGGFVGLGASIPLAILEVSNPTMFHLYLYSLANAAEGIEQSFASEAPGGPH